MHGIHFHKGRQSQLLEIGVSPALENTAVRDLCFVYLAWFELHFYASGQCFLRSGFPCRDRCKRCGQTAPVPDGL